MPLYQNCPPAVSTISEVACLDVFNSVLAERGNFFPFVFLLIISIIKFMDSWDWLVLSAQYLMQSLRSIRSNMSLHRSSSIDEDDSLEGSSSMEQSSSDSMPSLSTVSSSSGGGGRSETPSLLIGTLLDEVFCWLPKEVVNKWVSDYKETFQCNLPVSTVASFSFSHLFKSFLRW